MIVSFLPTSLAMAQGGKGEFTATDYANLVNSYGRGDFVLSTSALANVSEEEVRVAANAFRLRPRRDIELKAAALLHTEIVMSTGQESPFHLEMARSWLQELEPGLHQSFERRWHLTLSYHYLGSLSAMTQITLEAAAKAFPEDIEIRLASGTFHETSGWMRRDERFLKKAESEFRWILERKPDSAEALVRLGRVLALMGRQDQAITRLKRGLELIDDPRLQLAVHLTLGHIHLKKDELTEAIQSYRDALALDPQCQASIVALAHGLQKSGDSSASLGIIESSFIANEQARPGILASFHEKHDLWWRYCLGNSDRFELTLDELRKEVRP